MCLFLYFILKPLCSLWHKKKKTVQIFNIFPHLLEMNDKYYQSSFAFCIHGLSLEQAMLPVSRELFGLFVNMDKIFCFEK